MNIKGSTNHSYLLWSDRKTIHYINKGEMFIYITINKSSFTLNNFAPNSLNVHSKIRKHFVAF